MRRRAGWLAGLLIGCGSPPPPSLKTPLDEHVTLEVRTDPLELKLLRDGVAFLTAPRFVEIGVTSREPDLYVDPAAPKEVTFSAPARAIEWDGQTLTLEGGARLTFGSRLVLQKDGAALLRYVLPLGDDELYGLGELFDTPASRGVVREMQLRLDVASDAGTNEVHVPVPLALWPEWGLFADERRPGAFDVGAARSDAVLVTFATTSLAAQLYAGDAFAVLDQYTQQTGRPRAPPAWALAPMQWRNEGTQADVLDDAHMMRALGVPGGTIWIDNPWQTGYNTFYFDPARYPDPAQIVSELGSLGYKLLLWSTPYIDAASPDHAQAAAAGWLITDGHGHPYDWPWQNGPGALVDFTAAGATDFWRQRVHRAIGAAGFKLDFGEDLVPELGGRKTPFRLAQGGTDEWHAAYAGAYQAAYDAEFLLTRAGAAGSQSITTCIWPGDLDNDFSRHSAQRSGGLPAAVAAAASLAASGFPFFASDIGGFRGGVPTTEVLVRWAEAASLLPVMQLGGGGKSHNPWDATLFSAEALPIYIRYARLHMQLLPYLMALANQAAASGRPIVRAPGLVDRGHPYEDDFYVGDTLFAAPVVEAGAVERKVTLPPGEWIDWWSGLLAEGMQQVSAPLDTLPLWRKAGQMVPMFAQPIDTLLPDPGVQPLRVLLAPRGGAHFTLADGHELDVASSSTAITVSTDHPDVEFDLDSLDFVPAGSSLPSGAACAPPGCYLYQNGVAKLHLLGGGSATISR